MYERLTHPNIWKFSAIITALCFVGLFMSVSNQNATGTFINGFFLIVNGVAAIGNYKLRNVRREALEAQNRQTLIHLTIGK